MAVPEVPSGGKVERSEGRASDRHWSSLKSSCVLFLVSRILSLSPSLSLTLLTITIEYELEK